MQINLGISSREGTSDHRLGNYSHLLSLLDPERGYAGIITPKKVRVMSLVTFHDLDDIEIRAPQYLDCICPKEEHIVEILRTFSHMESTSGEGILVQCEAGVSRSTAAAILGLCHLGLEASEAFRTVTAINEVSLPNRRMLRLGGKMLGDNGALLELAEAHRKWIFNKHNQKDPTESLKDELFEAGYWNLQWKGIIWILRNLGRAREAGSDLKMINRLKTKLSMTKKTKGGKRKQGE